MEIKKLQNLVIDALEDVKAQDIQLFDTVHLTSLFDRIVIASGTSNRQTRALAASVRDKVKQNGGEIISIEGEDTGEWVLVDLGDMIIHIMQPAIRAYYRLEEIWGDKPVKFGAAKRTSKRSASEPLDEAAPVKKAGRHLTASRTTTVDEELPTKKARTRKPAAGAEAVGDGAVEAPKKPARKPAAKVAAGTKVKVAAKKSDTASAKAAKAAKPAAPKAAPKAAAPKRTTSKAKAAE